MKILVTGGAGYIGSFMVKRLLDDGHQVVVADSLERGHKEKVDPRAQLQVGDLLDRSFVENLFKGNIFDGVIHFAAYIAVGESMENPGLYFKNNIYGAINVLEAMHAHKSNNFIFSSTATVYGNPIQVPIPEDHPKNIENPYGESKLMVEKILAWYQKIYNINYTVLRYFNAAGAALDGSMGENHEPETHLIPNALRAALHNKPFSLYGDDYDTKDGTCMRDYIHVIDLVEAHVLALEKLQKENGGFIYNVGTGTGHTNKEVLEMVKQISGSSFPVKIHPRREGDAMTTIADASRIQRELGFTTKYSDLETIIKTAWAWHKKEVVT